MNKLQIEVRSAIGLLALASLCVFPVAAEEGAMTFPSAAAASEGLFQAVRQNNRESIVQVLGGPSDLTSDGDQADRERFAQKYQEMHRLCREADGSVTLTIGAENWPFPIPLIEKSGVWRFDASAGMKEILFRRIGENETTAMAICHRFAAARKSSATEAGVAAKLIGEAGGSEQPFHGYHFREAGSGKSHDGFALIAYPAEYRATGVMTFIVGRNGVVYEKDLGSDTVAIATTLATFHKVSSWRRAD